MKNKKEICKWYDVCPIVRFVKEGKLDKKWVENYCLKGGKNCKRFEMGKKGIYHPDNMLPNGLIDESL